MFGTIARFRLKDGVTDDHIQEMRRVMQDDPPPSSVAVIVYRSADDPRTMWVAGAFESREAYFANADTPEQKARFERLSEMTEGAPEWHDGDVLFIGGRSAGVG